MKQLRLVRGNIIYISVEDIIKLIDEAMIYYGHYIDAKEIKEKIIGRK